MQWFVNHAPHVLDEQIGLGPIDWRSPLQDDGFAEYRDAAFLERIAVTPAHRAQDSFWPRGGPQWDALGRARSGEAVIVEAKAHLSELYSPASGASEPSLAIIRASLAETARALGVAGEYDWSKQYYQYANRLAHAHFLETINGIRVKLVLVYFTGDRDMNGPATAAEWHAAIQKMYMALGLTSKPAFVCDVFIDVGPSGPD